jgi:hypothetical protein
LALFKLARTALTWHLPPHNEKLAKGLAGQAVASDRILLEAARRIAVAAVVISGRPWEQRVRLQGAVVERVVMGLAESTRAGGTVLHEQEIELPGPNRMRRNWSHSKDVVVDANPFEVYECKLSATFDQDDLNELADIRDAATAEGTTSRVAIVCLISELAVLERAALFSVPGDVRYASIESIAGIAAEAPKRSL